MPAQKLETAILTITPMTVSCSAVLKMSEVFYR